MGKLVNDDLISRSALLEAFGEEPYVWDGHDREQVQERNDWEYYTSITEAAPAVDAETVIKSLPYVKEALEMAKQSLAPVVRCKDCKHFCPYEGEEHKGDCDELVGLESCVYEDDFCSYGERRADDGA